MKETTYTGDGSGLMPQTPTENVGKKILAISDGKNLLSDFIKYAYENGWNITVEKSDKPDTFEKIFGDMKEAVRNERSNERRT